MTDQKTAVEQIDRDAAADACEMLYSPAKITAMREGRADTYGIVQAFARHRTRALEATQSGSDWFAGDVDCDGNELVTIRADELQKLKDDREKFMWQVRDTCARAEKAEAALSTQPVKRIEDGHSDTEGEALEMSAHLNCPTCGGSGHIDDTQPQTAGEPVAFMYETDDERWLSFDQENPDCIDCDFKQTPLYTGDLLAEAMEALREVERDLESICSGDDGPVIMRGKGTDPVRCVRKHEAQHALVRLKKALAKGERKQ